MRIRSIKPEWLDDEKIASLSDDIRLLSIGLILLADDYGNGRAHELYLASRIWSYGDSPESLRKVSGGIQELFRIGFIDLYEVNEQSYFHIVNWSKHQRVSHPGKPTVPGPEQAKNTQNIDNLNNLQKVSGKFPETFANISGNSPETLLNHSGNSPETLRTDREGEGERIKEEEGEGEGERASSRETPRPPPGLEDDGFGWRQLPLTGHRVCKAFRELTGWAGGFQTEKDYFEIVAAQCNNQSNPIETLEKVINIKKTDLEDRKQFFKPKYLAEDFQKILFDIENPKSKSKSNGKKTLTDKNGRIFTQADDGNYYDDRGSLYYA